MKTIAIKTPLGWTLFGNLSSGHCETINTNFLVPNKGTQLQHQIERFWKIDSYATKQALSEPPLSAEDKRTLATGNLAKQYSEREKPLQNSVVVET